MWFSHAWHLSLFFQTLLWWCVRQWWKGSKGIFPCHWSLTDAALRVSCHGATLQNLIIWKIWTGRSVSQAMFWIDVNKSCVFDRFHCCWFSQVIVSTPRAADRGLTDRRHRHACHCWQPNARSLWEAHGERVSIGMETQVYFISLPKCKGESAWETQRKRDRERQARPPQSLCSQLWWRPTQALENSANGFLMPANSRGI